MPEPEDVDLAIDLSPDDIVNFVSDEPEVEEDDLIVGDKEVSDRGWIDAAIEREEGSQGKDNAVLTGDPTGE